MADRIRPVAVREIARRHEEGCKTLLVSATFSGIARRAALAVGADGYIATEMERDEHGNYTGRVLGTVVEGAEKVWASVRWCDAHYGPGAWEFAYAYGDHRSDLGILSVAREGSFAVCPNSCDGGDVACTRLAGLGLGTRKTKKQDPALVADRLRRSVGNLEKDRLRTAHAL